MTLLHAVADHTGEDLTALPPLWSVLDPEALEGLLLHSRRTDTTVEFRYNGCRISMDSSGTIAISSD